MSNCETHRWEFEVSEKEIVFHELVVPAGYFERPPTPAQYYVKVEEYVDEATGRRVIRNVHPECVREG